MPLVDRRLIFAEPIGHQHFAKKHNTEYHGEENGGKSNPLHRRCYGLRTLNFVPLRNRNQPLHQQTQFPWREPRPQIPERLTHAILRQRKIANQQDAQIDSDIFVHHEKSAREGRRGGPGVHYQRRHQTEQNTDCDSGMQPANQW